MFNTNEKLHRSNTQERRVNTVIPRGRIGTVRIGYTKSRLNLNGKAANPAALGKGSGSWDSTWCG